jgi:hypothetical protein
MAALATPAHAASITVDVSQATVTCDTITGSLKFSTPLTLTGPTSGASTTTVKATLGGCTSPDVNAGGSIFKGAVTTAPGYNQLIGTGGSNCTGLAGNSASTGTLLIKWTAPKGYKFSPTLVVNGKTGSYSQPVIAQSTGATFTMPDEDASTPTPVDQGPFAGTQYGEFLVGGAFGTTNIHDNVNGDVFRGGDNGHSSWIAAMTNPGAINLLGQCTSTGIKSITLGVGATSAG